MRPFRPRERSLRSYRDRVPFAALRGAAARPARPPPPYAFAAVLGLRPEMRSENEVGDRGPGGEGHEQELEKTTECGGHSKDSVGEWGGEGQLDGGTELVQGGVKESTVAS